MKEINEVDVLHELDESVKSLEDEGAPYDKYLISSLIGAIGFARELNIISEEASCDLLKRARMMLKHGIDPCFAAKALEDLLDDIEKCDSCERDKMIDGAVGAISYAMFIEAISNFDGAVYLKRLRDLQI